MKIISGFKDYYDYVAFMYGGGDPNLVYLRTKVANSKEPGNDTLQYDFSGHIPQFPKFRERDAPWAFKWCVLNGRFYLLAQRSKFQLSNGMWHFDFNKGYIGYSLVTENHPCLKDCRPWDTGIYYDYDKKFDLNSIIGVEDKGFQLSKMVGTPAFTICDASSHRSPVYVDSIIPNLITSFRGKR